MNSRQKLNSAYLYFNLIFAAIAGALFQSWWAFWITTAALIALSINSGSIRPGGHRHH